MSRTCSECGRPLNTANKSGRCNFCYHGMGRRVRILDMFEAGRPLTEIGKELGMSKQAVRGVLVRAGAIGDDTREGSDTFHRSAAANSSRRLLAAYNRYYAGRPSLSKGGRPSTVAETLSYLDELSRTRALSLAESLMLERAIRDYDTQSARAA